MWRVPWSPFITPKSWRKFQQHAQILRVIGKSADFFQQANSSRVGLTEKRRVPCAGIACPWIEDSGPLTWDKAGTSVQLNCTLRN
ncbi:hypothetical protein IF1G_00478 [Cordyceps javanica]|uniref:Uncharacterized protein n=1 Tax=Cordyceps javanica TaxID=43265 RepID=A0A545VFP7_9HYPO|nr:hypothetical protein IF1G_00478 [Cordyceps javanica]